VVADSDHAGGHVASARLLSEVTGEQPNAVAVEEPPLRRFARAGRSLDRNVIEHDIEQRTNALARNAELDDAFREFDDVEPLLGHVCTSSEHDALFRIDRQALAGEAAHVKQALPAFSDLVGARLRSRVFVSGLPLGRRIVHIHGTRCGKHHAGQS
jgi:hypothetical protein